MKLRNALCILVLTSFNAFSQMYGAEGWAQESRGGINGRIIRVANLNASGSGSLAEALLATGNRIIVFEVGGVIDLGGSTISLKNPYVTVAGQTAPSPGITIIDGTISIQTHDVILQHIRVRVGAARHDIGWEKDGPSSVSAYQVVVDHCSISWATDENCSASGPRFDGNTPTEWRQNTSHDITISHCIIGEGLNVATHTKGSHSMGSLIHDNASNIAILKNLYISNKDRNPLFKGGSRGVIVNNFIHNPGSAAMRFALVPSEWEGYDWEISQISILGNVLEYGQDTGNIPLLKAGEGLAEIYMDDNLAFDQSGQAVAQYTGNTLFLVNEKPIWMNNIDIFPSEAVKDHVLEFSGARPWDRDEIDKRYINEATNGTGKIIDFETQVGGFPVMNIAYQAFEEKNWDLNRMIEYANNLTVSIPDFPEEIPVETSFLVETNIDESFGSVEFVELFVNDESVGLSKAAPYQWSIQSGQVGTMDLQVVLGNSEGRLWTSEKIERSIIDPILGIGETNFRVYPNPAKETLIVTGTHGIQELEIIDISGRPYYQGYFKKKQTIQVSNFPPGIYFVWVLDNGIAQCERIVIR